MPVPSTAYPPRSGNSPAANATVARRPDRVAAILRGLLRAAAPETAAALLSLIDPEAEIRYRHRLAREAYQRGHRDGYYRGREDEARDRDAAWIRIATPVARAGPSHAELEAKRWGPEGREHFADSRPGDFKGRTPRRLTDISLVPHEDLSSRGAA
jgi:hypothetical protein